LIFLLTISFSSYAQRNYLFENISIPEGLSNTEVHYIFQDSNGFLWISTADGLNRYDGNSMKVFKNDPNDSTTIPNNNCYAITEDSEGFIWAGIFGNAIAKYNPTDETFRRYPIETGSVNNISEFNSALSDSKGNIWFGSTKHEMQKFNRSKNRFEQVRLDSTNNNAHWGEIYGITELKNGNIIAADFGNGIKIYNEKLNVFRPYYLKTNYSPDRISAICEDASGNIWLGGSHKLIKFSTANYTTEDYDLFSLFKDQTNSDNISGIIQDDEGYLWVGVYTFGIYRIDLKTKNIKKFDYSPIISNSPEKIVTWKIYKDKYGVIWIGTQGMGLVKFDPLREPFNYSKFNTEEVAGSSTNYATVIAGSQHDKVITVGTSAKGLFSYDLANNKSISLKIKFVPLTIPDGKINIQSLTVDENGNKWFSYNNSGLYKIDNNIFLSSIESPHQGKTTIYVMNTMKIDLSGNIWYASSYGFEKYDPAKNEYSLLPTIMTKRMSENLKQEINEITRSREPISSILKVGEASNLEKDFSLINDQKVLIICIGEGRMVQGTDGIWDTGSLLTSDGKPVWSMNDLSRTFNDGGGFKNRIAVKCVDLKKGDYKITFATDAGHSYGYWNVVAPPDSSWYGIQVLGLNESEYSKINELNDREINSDKFLPMEVGSSIEFSKILHNVLWLGSISNGFFKYDLATGNYKQYNFDLINKFSPNNSITCIFEDRAGIVWMAMQNNLIRFDPITEKIEKFGQKDGLPSSTVNSIIEDLQGNLWISTSGGLSKLNKNAPKDKWNFVNFDIKDGLQRFSSSKASWISKDGEIVLGSKDGIISFYPGKINEVKPDIVIEDIKVSEVSLKSDSAVVKLGKSIMKLDELDLSYAQNNISFEFASIHFSRPENNKIVYKLEGFNNHWISTDRNFASFTNLAPGKYTFRVKGSNADGIWNDDGKAILIIISPPWWKTWWAYVFYGLLFLALVFIYDRIQRRRHIEIERAQARENELEQAKEIEKAYHKLQNTQNQLIQAEKMASLGELTAGIAHEIQNPLNFVNNFSDVSNELIDEMIGEIEMGNTDEAKAIAHDVKQNLEKINHHGKRADAIVKGMLLHSRSSSSVKEPTNINAIADEYLRLAYHGLRAKDKSFNATMKTDFDETIGNINVIPQDIGRVILNLITNAFYAVTEKKKGQPEGYEPTVWVSTKKINGRVEVRVKDNGNGIPKNIFDKVFQPFFTTKPTGEGTGLGLSLSYDIITKGHRGELKVETKESEGTEFIIVLPDEII